MEGEPDEPAGVAMPADEEQADTPSTEPSTAVNGADSGAGTRQEGDTGPEEDADADAELEPLEPQGAPLAEGRPPEVPPAERTVPQYWDPDAKRGPRWPARILVLLAVALPAYALAVVIPKLLNPVPDADTRLANDLRYDANGDPLVLAPTGDLGIGTVRRRQWRVCGTDCSKVSGRGSRFTPREVLAGSRVELTLTGTTGTTTITTPDWDGRLAATQRPALVGDPIVGQTVEAKGGEWTGGWVGAERMLGIRACPTKQGGGKCVAFTASILHDGFDPKRTIPPSFRGWWIGAIEWHVPPLRDRSDLGADGDPARPSDAERAPLRSVTVALGPLEGPIR